jgi:hypothetical protein
VSVAIAARGTREASACVFEDGSRSRAFGDNRAGVLAGLAGRRLADTLGANAITRAVALFMRFVTPGLFMLDVVPRRHFHGRAPCYRPRM